MFFSFFPLNFLHLKFISLHYISEECHVILNLSRFCYFTQQQKMLFCFSHHSQELIEKFIVPILNSLLLPKKQERNLHVEILAEKHHCLLDQVIPFSIILWTYLLCGDNLTPKPFPSTRFWSHRVRFHILSNCIVWLRGAAGKAVVHCSSCILSQRSAT